MAIVGGIQPFKCKYCGFECNYGPDMEDHIRIEHWQEKDRLNEFAMERYKKQYDELSYSKQTQVQEMVEESIKGRTRRRDKWGRVI